MAENSDDALMIERPLFGGAMRIWIPVDFMDASEIRQIPDHQEVFLDAQSERSLVIEILEMPSEQLDVDAGIRFHFSQLAVDNSAQEEALDEESLVSSRKFLANDVLAELSCANGYQKIRKFGADPCARIEVAIALIRCVTMKTDILVSLNQPESALAKAGRPLQSINFEAIAQSFKVTDWSILGR